MEILKLFINIKEINTVESDTCTAVMILFDGRCDGPYFQGTILNGGVDTQIVQKDKSGTLSARYIVDGKDCEGTACRLFIENNGILKDDGIVTTPKILTDSPVLKWMETAVLSGYIDEPDGQLTIHINLLKSLKKI